MELTYISPAGERFDLMRGAVRIEHDTLAGFVGTIEDTPIVFPGVAGQWVDMRDQRVGAMEGGFTAIVIDPDKWGEFRAAWSHRLYGQLILESGGLQWHLAVRLSAPLAAPTFRPTAGARIPVALVADRGVWESTGTGTGTVEITNFGDITVWPSIVWSGSGQRITLPSGATIALPTVTGEHTVSLDRTHGGIVTRAGQLTGISVDLVSEGVPAGQTRTYKASAGARLEWGIGVLDPWR